MDIDIEDIKSHLEKCRYMSDATASYDIMAGGLIWSDEIPQREECDDYLKVALYLRPIIAYRASLTLGNERIEFKKHWLKLNEAIPYWPGFKPERIRGEAERLLRIHKYKEDKVIKKLEDEL